MILEIVDGPNQPHSCFSQMIQPQAKQNATCKADRGPTKAGQRMKMDHVRIREASVMVTAQQLSYHRGCAEKMDHIQTLPRNTIRGYGFVYRSPGASHSDIFRRPIRDSYKSF